MMANLPPRKVSTSSKGSKQDASPLQILLQMGFPKNRALKALAATGNRSVQLASDWLLTHVNDTDIDTEHPREYIFYASPTGPLLDKLHEFWEKSKVTGWNGAHNFPPHVTLVPFFTATDEVSLQLAKTIKQTVEIVGPPPAGLLKLEPYISPNFMGLFISEEHADYLKKIAVQYAKQVSNISSGAEAQVQSLHITLAYHFATDTQDALRALVDTLPYDPAPHAWELRLYSRDPRFANHQVYKVTQNYVPEACDELELVPGDYIYIEDNQFDNSSDGWVYGTSWLTGVGGHLPGVCVARTPHSDAWTLHRAVSLGARASAGADSKSVNETKMDSDMATEYPYEDAPDFAFEKSEETFKTWENYWNAAILNKTENVLNDTKAACAGCKDNGHRGDGDAEDDSDDKEGKRWVLAMRHGERVDLTYGSWVPHCFDESGTYVRKDLNMPLRLPDRVGGKESYARDTPLTRVGHLQAFLVGEALRAAGVRLAHVYASSALRCVETAHNLLQGLKADPSIKIKVEPGLFEYKGWHMAKGLAPFMTPLELHKAGFNVDLNYKPIVDLDVETTETLEDFYKRNELVMQLVVNETEADGGNVMFVGHASTLDVAVSAIKRLESDRKEYVPYQVSKHLLRVPYCALGALRGRPWRVVRPPCPPAINSSSGRFDWKLLLDQDE